MPTFEEELNGLGNKPSFEDELNALGGSTPSPAPAPQQQSGGLWDSILEGGSDAVRGLNAGMYWGGSDEAEGALNSLAGRGDSLGSNVEAARGANMQAEQRSPWLYNAGKAAGYVPGMLMAPASAMARVGAAGMQGMASGALSSDSNDAGETMDDSMLGGLIGAGTSAATELGAAAWGGLKSAGGKVVDWADEARNAAFGGTAGDYQKLARTEGLDYVEGGPGEAARRLGLTNKLIPQSPSTYARRSEAMMGDVGAQKAAALALADQYPGTHVITDDLAQGLQRRGAGQLDATPEGMAEQARMNDMADLLRQQQGPMMPPSELDAQKQAYYRRGYQQGKIPDSQGSLGAEANRLAGSEARGQLDDAMQYAPPGVNAQLQNANQDYGELATINTMAQNRAAGMQAPQGGGFFSTLTSPATTALKKYAPDALANGMNLAGEGMQGLGGAMQSGAQAMTRAPFGPGAGAMQQDGDALDSLANEGAAQSRGYLLPQAAQQLMQQRGSLGPYEKQFWDAANSQDSNALSNLITKLSHTDPQFRQSILPKLQQLTAQGY